jgi:F-type H+-transporting ATPase subunit b
MTIDWWTIGIQTVNVVILMWLLGKFFWRPVARMIDQRRDATQKTLAEADANRGVAVAALADIEKTRAGFAGEREAILGAARDDAKRAHTACLDKAAKEAAALETAAKTRIEKEEKAADKAWTDHASRLAVDIAQRLAARLDGPTVRAAFFDWLLKQIRNLPEPARQAAAANGANLDVVSATVLDPADQERYRGLIGAAFGAQPQIAFKTDPALIIGLELRGPHLSVSNSWRADLSKILAELMHDNQR